LLFSPFARALREDHDFAPQHIACRRPTRAIKTRAQHFLQRQNSITIHAPQGTRQLIGMTTPLDDESLGNQGNRILRGDAQPKVVVFAYGKRLIEAADPLEKLPRHHHRGRTYQTEIQATHKDVTGRLSMNRFRIDSDTLANPDLVGLANLNLRVPIQEGYLGLQFTRQPQIVGIKKRNVTTMGLADTEITRRSDAPSRCRKQPQSVTEFCQSINRAVSRTIIDHDDLKISKTLRKHRVDGFGN
jgi:hypothetical protein